MPRQELVARGAQLLGVEEESLEIQLGNLCIERKLIIKLEEEEERVYAAAYYYMELNTAKMLHDLNVPYACDETMVLRRLEKLEAHAGMELDELQRAAVMGAVKNGVFILTGGPGTGKTTTINALIRYFESEGMDIMLAAPTVLPSV